MGPGVRFAGGYFVVSTHLREGLLQPEEFVDKAVFEVENPAPERRARGKTKQSETQEENDPTHEAEIYADRVLTSGRPIMIEDIEMVMEMLPGLQQPRQLEDPGGKTWSAGAFVHGGCWSENRNKEVSGNDTVVRQNRPEQPGQLSRVGDLPHL